MTDREKVIKGLEDIKNSLIPKIAAYYGSGASGMYACKYYKETLNNAIDMLKQEAMVKPTKCPCGELFDAKDSSFCPKCGCAYGEPSGRYTNIGR